MMAMAKNIWAVIPTDVLVEVLQRLHPSTRRRCRLVCQLWRDAVDTHTNEMQISHPKMLVAITESLYLIEDDDEGGVTVRLWSYGCRASLIGVCNGLICLCDNTRPGGAITIGNPLTGATLAIPPLPLPYTVVSNYWQQTYCFAYHATTGWYKVMHLQCDFNRAWVFTLGGTSWWGVPDDTAASKSSPAGASANPNPGIVGVDGAVYWAVQAQGVPLIMALDLADKRITSIRPIPSLPRNPNRWNLVAVGARLGIVITNSWRALSETEVWVMDDVPGAAATRRHRWSRRYVVQIHRPPFFWEHEQYLTWPLLFTQDGEHILTMKRLRDMFSAGFVLYKHKLLCDDDDTQKQARSGVVVVDERNRGMVVANVETDCNPCRTFTYVETTEPLSVYRRW